jgi:peptide/nickel transport system substrate-binding protein
MPVKQWTGFFQTLAEPSIAVKPGAMPRLPHARVLGLALALALGIVPAACNPKLEGAARVAVIGPQPRLKDPSAELLRPGDAVLLTNVAQGLVRFDARGQVEPGLAERWTVSDDGLSYIFRLAAAEWPGGGKITAHQVARALRRHVAARSPNPLKDTLGAVTEIVAMTDRVLEIRLSAPRTNLLQLLAQPDLAVMRNGQGSGPFRLREQRGPDGQLWLRRTIEGFDGEQERREDIWLSGTTAADGIRNFKADAADMVLGGSFADLPLVQAARLPRRALIFDPAAGLFGLVPTRNRGPLANVELRRLLSQAVDRVALAQALNVPGLIGRATVLEPGLIGVPDPAPPAWTTVPIGERRPDLIAAADRLFASEERRTLRIRLPEGPGAELLLRRLAEDWRLLGITVERAGRGVPADLRLIDVVAPSDSPAWYLRHFRCEAAAICSEGADTLLEAARAAPVPAQRGALLSEAARLIDEAQLFLPLSAPVRWSLVSARIDGFAGNRFARHTLTGLEQRLADPRR